MSSTRGWLASDAVLCCVAKILQDELAVSRLQLMCGIPILWWATTKDQEKGER